MLLRSPRVAAHESFSQHERWGFHGSESVSECSHQKIEKCIKRFRGQLTGGPTITSTLRTSTGTCTYACEPWRTQTLSAVAISEQHRGCAWYGNAEVTRKPSTAITGPFIPHVPHDVAVVARTGVPCSFPSVLFISAA